MIRRVHPCGMYLYFHRPTISSALLLIDLIFNNLHLFIQTNSHLQPEMSHLISLFRLVPEIRLQIFKYALQQAPGNNPSHLMTALCENETLYNEAVEGFFNNEDNYFWINVDMLEAFDPKTSFSREFMKRIRNVVFHVECVSPIPLQNQK